MMRSQCTALFFEHDRSRYDAEIFPITRQYYGNDVIYAQYPVSICIWIAQELELKPSINFFTTNRCEASIKIDFFSIFPLFFEPFNAVRKKSLKIFNIVFPGFGKNSALRSRHVLSSNFKTDYSWQTEWQYDFNGNEMKDCFSIKNCFKTPPLPVKPTSSKSIWSVCFDEMWWRRHSLLSNYVGSTNSMKLFSLSIRFTSNFIYDAIDLQLRSLFQDCFLWDFHRSAVKLKIYELKWRKTLRYNLYAWSRWSITKYTYQS